MKFPLGIASGGHRKKPTVVLAGVYHTLTTVNATNRNWPYTLPAGMGDGAIVFATYEFTTSAAHVVNSVTWNGRTGIRAVAQGQGITNNYQRIELWVIPVVAADNGVTADIIVTANGTSASALIGVWPIKDFASITPILTAQVGTNAANTYTLAFGTPTPDGSLAVCFATCWKNVAVDFDWTPTGVEDFEDDSVNNHTAGWHMEAVPGGAAFNVVVAGNPTTNWTYGVGIGAMFN